MAFPTLSSAIVQSLRAGQMHPDFPAALLSQERNKVRVRGEDRHWDYKEKLSLTQGQDAALRLMRGGQGSHERPPTEAAKKSLR